MILRKLHIKEPELLSISMDYPVLKLPQKAVKIGLTPDSPGTESRNKLDAHWTLEDKNELKTY